MSELKKLSIEHPYYCSDSNYYTNDVTITNTYKTMTDFLSEWEDEDIDLNLCFRFDIYKKEDEEGYWGEVFIMQQRQGLFIPNIIQNITEDEAKRFKEYLQKHWNTLKEMWKPLSGE